MEVLLSFTSRNLPHSPDYTKVRVNKKREWNIINLNWFWTADLCQRQADSSDKTLNKQKCRLPCSLFTERDRNANEATTKAGIGYRTSRYVNGGTAVSSTSSMPNLRHNRYPEHVAKEIFMVTGTSDPSTQGRSATDIWVSYKRGGQATTADLASRRISWTRLGWADRAAPFSKGQTYDTKSKKSAGTTAKIYLDASWNTTVLS